MALYKHHYNNDKLSIREKVQKVNKLIADHEKEIANPILNYIHNREDLNLIGKKIISNKDRAPTIAFTSNNKTSKEVSKILVSNKIATRNDNFYAWRCLEALGIDTEDGLVRLSLTHYNSKKDSDLALKALKKL